MKFRRNQKVDNVLYRLHEDAKYDFVKVGAGVMKSIFRPVQPQDFEHAYLPISKEQGQSLHRLIIENKCKNIVEFGTSFGISTIYLANAVRQTGGKVITTELLESKAKMAAQNISEAGLKDYVDVRTGDAMKTLQGHTAPIDLLVLDGWKDLYLPLFKMLEPCFHSKSLIYADNMDMAGTKPYADYVLRNQNKFMTQSVDNGKAFITRMS